MAGENLAAYGVRAAVRLVEADLAAAGFALPPVDGYFFDPARRAQGRRVFSVRDYHPPLERVRGWLASAPAAGVKISPGVRLAELAEYDCEVEFISDRGELKEAVLWFGPLKTAARRATRLPAEPGPALSLLADPAATPRLGPPDAYLYEPDPAVLRAGLVTTLAAQLGAHQLDPDIAYLAAPGLAPTPWARAFAIEAAMPFQLKRLRAWLRERGVGQLTVKKRGSPLEPEALIRQLKPAGPASRVLFLTHVRGQPWVLVGTPVEAASG
jgi:hypothetical protein